jgi:transposase-like protein
MDGFDVSESCCSEAGEYPGVEQWFALGFLEALECGRMRVMTTEITPGKPTTRRYTKQEKDQAVRLVFELRKELGTSQGTVVRIAEQLGYGTESVRRWVLDAEIEAGDAPGMSAVDRTKMKKLEQENRELRRANEILKTASAFFAAELDRPHK